MTNNTKFGLYLILIGVIISFISSIILVPLFFLLNNVSFSGISYLLFPSSIISSVGGILVLIGAIFVIIGRKDYGEKHSKYVIYSIIIFITGFALTVIFSSLIAFFSFSSIMTNGTTNLFGYFGVITMIASILFGISYVLFLHELLDKKGKIILYALFVIIIVSGVLTSFFITGVFGQIGQTYNNFQQTDILNNTNINSQLFTLGILPIFTQILGFISSLLLIIVIYIAYKRVKTGELKPVTSFDNLKRCINCGKYNPPDSNLCAYCGYRFF